MTAEIPTLGEIDTGGQTSDLAEGTDEQLSAPHKTRRSILKNILLAIALLLVFLTTGLILAYGYYLTEINKEIIISQDQVKLTVEKGSSVGEIAVGLQNLELVKDARLLKVYMYLNKDKTIQAGRYSFSPKGLTLVSLVDKLQNGSFSRTLTFIEGWRIEEYVDYLREELGDEYSADFMESEFVKEGYMFPDTYTIEEGYDAANLASWMRNNFDKRFTQELKNKALLRGLSESEVVIMASILEREMNIAKDRPVVAGILIKRWQNDWAIQADATVQYAKGKNGDWWPTVSRADLRGIDSPYNTYTNQGLPIGPICNPSLTSIKAVVEYEESPYWFYITGDDGITHYAETLEEHNLNVAKYL